MTCPQCTASTERSKVIETRMVLGGANAGMKRRRRDCSCGARYATYQPVGRAEVTVTNTMSESAVAAAVRKESA